VNELNELQSSKSIDSEMMLLIFLVIAEGFGLKNFANMEANLTTDSTDSPPNYILNFFVITIILFGIGTL